MFELEYFVIADESTLLPIEHKTYKEALQLFCEDKLTIKGRVVNIED